MSKMLPWEKTDLPFMLIMDQKSWPLCVIPLSACSAVLVFLPSLLACATTLVIPMLLYKSCPSLLVRTHKPWYNGYTLGAFNSGRNILTKVGHLLIVHQVALR